jgi:Family of unknown function (DUF6353)
MDISQMARKIGPLITRNSSSILTGLGAAASVTSLVMGIKATPIAIRKLDRAYAHKNQDPTEVEQPLTKREVLKVVWRDYAPAIGVQIIAVGCIVSAQSINLRKQAALISAFSITETAFREYQDRMSIEAPTKDRKVRDDIAKGKLDANPISAKEVLLIGNGDQIFYDSYTDRYFMSTMQKVQKTVNDINFRIINQEYAALNEFYSAIGLNAIPSGDELGWTSDQPLELDYSTQFTDDDRASVVITFVRNPILNYWKGFR